MPFNGSGTYVRTYNWTNDANANIDISSTRMDTEDNGFATGLSTAICKDGQTNPIANLPMNSFKHTGVANATLANHYAAYGQVQNGMAQWLGTSSGTNTVTAAASPTLTAYAAGQTFRFIVGATNTDAVTLNIDSLGAESVLKNGNALGPGDWTLNDIAEVVYNGTAFNITSPARTPFVPTGALQPNTIGTTQDTIASATATDLGTIITQNVLVSGTTTITGFGSSASTASPIYMLEFSGILTLTYNATSLILPTGANITTAAGDTATAEYLGSGDWKIRDYKRLSGQPLAPPITGVTQSPGDNSTNLATTAFVTAAVAAAPFPNTAGAVNTYILGKNSGSTVAFGATIAGSSLLPCTGSASSTSGTVSGTWQCNGAGNTTGATTYIRIA